MFVSETTQANKQYITEILIVKYYENNFIVFEPAIFFQGQRILILVINFYVVDNLWELTLKKMC